MRDLDKDERDEDRIFIVEVQAVSQLYVNSLPSHLIKFCGIKIASSKLQVATIKIRQSGI